MRLWELVGFNGTTNHVGINLKWIFLVAYIRVGMLVKSCRIEEMLCMIQGELVKLA
jgi:hypothetical protein